MGARSFTWDSLGRLKTVEQNRQELAGYGYDSQNRRVRKTVGAKTTYYLYDLGEPAAFGPVSRPGETQACRFFATRAKCPASARASAMMPASSRLSTLRSCMRRRPFTILCSTSLPLAAYTSCDTGL